MKKLTILTVTLVLIAAMAVTTANAQEPIEEVRIPDDNLAAAIRETLGLPTDAVITADAMRNLTWLEAPGKGIAALTGLEHATNLTRLDLRGAWVGGEWHTNPISDVSPLAALTQLTHLWLAGTAVSDVSALAGLTQLQWLDLRGCPLSYASFHTHIPAMQAKGIEVEFDNVADVNGDGIVNIQDLVLVSGQLGKTGENSADVNGDSVVNILDLVFVAGAFH